MADSVLGIIIIDETALKTIHASQCPGRETCGHPTHSTHGMEPRKIDMDNFLLVP